MVEAENYGLEMVIGERVGCLNELALERLERLHFVGHGDYDEG